MKKLNLNEAAEEFDVINFETHLFYNKKTGEFGFYGEYMDDETANAEEFESEEWVAAPSQHDLREYGIMEAFAESVVDSRARELLFVSLEGEGAFRRFKDTLFRVDLRDEWFAFKHKAFVKIARDWCDYHGIEYTDIQIKDEPAPQPEVEESKGTPCDNVTNCPCPKTECPNNRKCCACVVKHKKGGKLPFCLRKNEGENK